VTLKSNLFKLSRTLTSVPNAGESVHIASTRPGWPQDSGLHVRSVPHNDRV
jgi:hypothetical protein